MTYNCKHELINMDPILGRSQFLSETVNLFTDEKTANARARVSLAIKAVINPYIAEFFKI